MFVTHPHSCIECNQRSIKKLFVAVTSPLTTKTTWTEPPLMAASQFMNYLSLCFVANKCLSLPLHCIALSIPRSHLMGNGGMGAINSFETAHRSQFEMDFRLNNKETPLELLPCPVLTQCKPFPPGLGWLFVVTRWVSS